MVRVTGGLFAIATATAEAFNSTIPHTSPRMFEQAGMRAHLIQCFEKGELSMFPVK